MELTVDIKVCREVINWCCVEMLSLTIQFLRRGGGGGGKVPRGTALPK